MRCRRKREAEGKKASFAEEMRRIEAARGSKLSGESLLFVARFCNVTRMGCVHTDDPLACLLVAYTLLCGMWRTCLPGVFIRNSGIVSKEQWYEWRDC